MAWRGLLAVGMVLACSGAFAADKKADGDCVHIKLFNGLEFIGILKNVDDENLTLRTPLGEKSLRRTDIIVTRRNLTDAEKAGIRNAVAEFERPPVPAVREGVAAAASGRIRVLDEGRERRASGVFGARIEPHFTAYERISRALDKKVSVEFVDTPLEEAISFLGTLTGANFIMNPKVREAKPVVTLKVRDMDAGTAVMWLTKLTESFAEVKDEAIYITDKPSPEVADEERNDILMLAASMHATVDLPPEGQPLTNADRAKIALQLWEKEEPKLQDFPGPDVGLIGALEPGGNNPFGAAPGR